MAAHQIPDKYGMFSQPPYIPPVFEDAVRTTRTKKEPTETKLNFVAGRPKKADKKTPADTFGDFLPLQEGVKYEDTLRLALRAKKESSGRNVSDVPFKTVSPMKQSATPGDFFGTSGKVPYVPSTPEVKPKKKGDIPVQPKGIYTSPAKKGTFGFNKTTLSERQGHKGVASEYEYQHDPLPWQEQKKKAEREASAKAKVVDAPFKPSNPGKKGTFGVPNTTISRMHKEKDGKPKNGVVGEWEYQVGSNPMHQPTKHTDSKEGPPPFMPSTTHASQRIQHIEYLHDPEVPKIRAEATRRREEQKKLAEKGAWKPNMGRKTDMVRSIVRMNIK